MKNLPFFKSTTFLAIIACILWSTAFVGVKIGLKYNSPLQFAGIRFFISGLMILPFIPNIRSKVLIAWGNRRKIILVGFIQTFLQYALFYTGMNFVPGALGAMVIGSGPLFIALVAHFLMPGDKLTYKKTFSIALGLLGIVVISLGRKSMGATGNLVLFGMLVLIANNILAGFGNILVAKDQRKIPPLILSSFSMIFGGVLLFLTGIFIEGFKCGPFPVEYYISLGWLSFLSAAAISIWYTLLKRPEVKVSNLNMWKFIIPVLGAILSWAILPDEKPTIISILGMSLVALALISLSVKLRGK